MSAQSESSRAKFLVPILFGAAIVVSLSGTLRLALGDDKPGGGAADRAPAAAESAARDSQPAESAPRPTATAPSGPSAADRSSAGTRQIDRSAGQARESARQDARDVSRDARGSARETSRDARGSARDTSRDVRSGARESTRTTRQDTGDVSRELRRDARDKSRDVREDARDTSRDVRRDTRDTSRDVRAGARETDRTTRTDARDGRRGSRRDLGLSFSTDRDRLRVGEIRDDSVFATAGIRRGDVIVSFNGRRLRSEDEFNRYYYQTRRRAPVIILRDGREETIYIEPAADLVSSDQPSGGGGYLGVMLDQSQRDAAVVRGVHPNSPAEEAGLQRGDVVVAVNGEEIVAMDHLSEVIGGYAPGTDVELEIDMGDRTDAVMVTLGSRPNVPVTAVPRERVEVRAGRVITGAPAPPAPPIEPAPGPVVEPTGEAQIIINNNDTNRPTPRRERVRERRGR